MGPARRKIKLLLMPGPGGIARGQNLLVHWAGCTGMEAFATHPEQHGPFPAVVVFMDIWGLREELFDIARRVATVGYYFIVPDFYSRQGRKVGRSAR
jgi:dienelactone hydrolase